MKLPSLKSFGIPKQNLETLTDNDKDLAYASYLFLKYRTQLDRRRLIGSIDRFFISLGPDLPFFNETLTIRFSLRPKQFKQGNLFLIVNQCIKETEDITGIKLSMVNPKLKKAK